MIQKARPIGDSGIIKLLNESHEASPAHPLKNFLARILGRNFSQVIGSNRTQQKHWKGFCANLTQTPGPAKILQKILSPQNYAKSDSGHSHSLTSKRGQGKKSGAVMPAGLHAARPMKPPAIPHCKLRRCVEAQADQIACSNAKIVYQSSIFHQM